MPLRRLTKFSRLELEKESDTLKREIDELTSILDDDGILRTVVSDELAAVAQQHATPRRTLLLEGNASVASASVPLEVDDEPCVVLMSSTGLLARSSDLAFDPLADVSRAAHDVIVSNVPATTRGHVGLVTSAGRVVRLSVLDLPSLPSVMGIPALSAGAPIGAFVDLPADEQALCLTTLDESGGIALATAAGTVKRVIADSLGNKDSWEIIRLDDGDRVVGATRLDDTAAKNAELILVASDGQLLRFPASSVRPQGRAANGRDQALPRCPRRLLRRAHACTRCGRRHDRRNLIGTARHRRWKREDHPARRVSRQGAGNRRRQVPSLPLRRGSHHVGLGGQRPGPCGECIGSTG